MPPIDKSGLKKVLNMVALNEGFKMGRIDYIFCDDQYLLEINKAYLQHDFFTDIITFDYTENNKLSGEIYVSIERIKDNAIRFKSDVINELNRVIIHGLLHLCGYKDKTKIQKVEMRSKEDEYLSKITQ